MGLISFINKDVNFENETKRGMVTLRVLCLIIVFALTVDILLVGTDIVIEHPLWITGSYIMIILLFIQTYHARPRTGLTCFFLFMCVWILFMIRCFGWDAGMQNYFLIILIVSFFSTHDSNGFKFALAGILLLFRILYGFLYSGTEAAVPVDSTTGILLHTTNITAIFLAAAVVSYFGSREGNAEESKLMKFNDRLVRAAGTDPLTGLNNRRYAADYLAWLRESGVYNAVSVAIGDIDFFKKVNDTYGHDAGDEVLKFVASAMKEKVGETGLLARWGGEEFLLVLPGKNGDEAHVMLETIRSKIEDSTIRVKEHEIRVTMTFGLTEYDFNGDLDHTVKEADEKLYIGKTGGRNRVVY